MGIAGDKPRQLAPTVGTTGSGSTGSPASSSSSYVRSHLFIASTLGQTGRRLRNIIAAARSSSDLQDPDILEAFCEQRLG
jgi:hypothetical protein